MTIFTDATSLIPTHRRRSLVHMGMIGLCATFLAACEPASSTGPESGFEGDADSTPNENTDGSNAERILSNDSVEVLSSADLGGCELANIGGINVAAIGSNEELELVTWNVRNFPQSGPNSEQVVLSILNDMDADVIALQEVTSLSAFERLVACKPGYTGIISNHEYQSGNLPSIKPAFLIRDDRVRLSAATLIFESTYDFPRPVLKASGTLLRDEAELAALQLFNLHLKAGTGSEDRERREDAIFALTRHLDALTLENPNSVNIAMGDYNEEYDESDDNSAFTPMLTNHDVLEPSGNAYSLVISRNLVDHIVVSSSFAAIASLNRVSHLPLDENDSIFNYVDAASDHVPVVAVYDL